MVDWEGIEPSSNSVQGWHNPVIPPAHKTWSITAKTLLVTTQFAAVKEYPLTYS
jgi:hypothetical protein